MFNSVAFPVSLLLLWLFPLCAVSQPAAIPLEPVEHLFDIEGFVLPSDVVVSNQRIFIVDGGSNRVVATDLSGRILYEIGANGTGEMKGPVGIAADSQGRIYVCDSGNGRLRQFDKNGKLVREFPIRDSKGQAVRPVDVQLNEYRQAIYLSDGKNHKVIAYSTAGDYLFEWGSRGTLNSEFRYPATMAMDSERNVYVVDILNTRVQRFNEKGSWNANIGTWGVLPGSLFRPKGVALDRQGRVYIADSFMDVIQVFEGSRFLHALGDTSGKIRNFIAPGGIYIQDDRLYVVEMFAKKVGVYKLE